jgi:hypothetical protein
MRGKAREIVMSLAAVGLVLLVLMSFDEHVRQDFSMRWHQGPTAQAAEFGYAAGKLGMTVAQAARDQGLAHTPILILVFAGSVLLLFMTRT